MLLSAADAEVDKLEVVVTAKVVGAGLLLEDCVKEAVLGVVVTSAAGDGVKETVLEVVVASRVGFLLVGERVEVELELVDFVLVLDIELSLSVSVSVSVPSSSSTFFLASLSPKVLLRFRKNFSCRALNSGRGVSVGKPSACTSVTYGMP